MVMNVVLVEWVLGVSLLADLAIVRIDPRIRSGGRPA
jgi:ABC-type dipeptide/oligopeptide/nickel transport system permease component